MSYIYRVYDEFTGAWVMNLPVVSAAWTMECNAAGQLTLDVDLSDENVGSSRLLSVTQPMRYSIWVQRPPATAVGGPFYDVMWSGLIVSRRYTAAPGQGVAGSASTSGHILQIVANDWWWYNTQILNRRDYVGSVYVDVLGQELIRNAQADLASLNTTTFPVAHSYAAVDTSLATTSQNDTTYRGSVLYPYFGSSLITANVLASQNLTVAAACEQVAGGQTTSGFQFASTPFLDPTPGSQQGQPMACVSVCQTSIYDYYKSVSYTPSSPVVIASRDLIGIEVAEDGSQMVSTVKTIGSGSGGSQLTTTGVYVSGGIAVPPRVAADLVVNLSDVASPTLLNTAAAAEAYLHSQPATTMTLTLDPTNVQAACTTWGTQVGSLALPVFARGLYPGQQVKLFVQSQASTGDYPRFPTGDPILSMNFRVSKLTVTGPTTSSAETLTVELAVF